MNKLVIAAFAVLTASSLWAIQGTIRTETDTQKGDIKWRGRDRTYVIEIMKGKTPVSMERKADDVVEILVDKPAGFDKAADLVARGQGTAAVATLQKIVSDYKMLQWDKPAARMLVDVYLDGGDAAKALEVATKVVSDDKRAAYVGEFAPSYWQALLRTGKTAQLESNLKKAVTSGDRGASAAAMVMRGDMILAEAENPETLRKALTDAYLRVALMCRDEACREARVTALERAAACFDKLGQAARAEGLRAQIKAL